MNREVRRLQINQRSKRFRAYLEPQRDLVGRIIVEKTTEATVLRFRVEGQEDLLSRFSIIHFTEVKGILAKPQ